MKILEFMSFLDRKKIEESKICFKVFAFRQKFWFYCEPGTSYEDFINGSLLGEGECLHDLEMPETVLGNLEFTTMVHSYNKDGSPNEIEIEIRCDQHIGQFDMRDPYDYEKAE